MMKKTILFVMPQLNMGGAERVITLIMNSIDREIFDVKLILFNSRGDLVETILSDIEIYDLDIYSVSRGLIPLFRKIYQIKPNIVFSGIGHLNISIAPFIPIFRYIVPKIYWIARQSSILSLNNQKEKSPKLYEWLYKRVYKNYDKIICQSNYMQKDLIDRYLFPIEKSVVINNPVDIESIERLSLAELEYPFDSNRFNLLSVGQLRPEKRQEHIIRAFAKLGEGYSLTLIGEGDSKERLEDLAYQLGISKFIRFIGYQANPYSYMKRADILVLSSEYEGFPNVVSEANICGLGVISYKCAGGVAEIIKDGVNGLLVADGDIEALADGIKRAKKYRFDYSKIGKKYNKNLIINKYQKILKRENTL